MTDVGDTGRLRAPHVLLLKFAVVVMGLLILAGLVAVAARIIYLASRPSAQSPPSGPRLESRARLALPPGAAIRQIAVSGDRLAVHYESPAGPGIAVVDIPTGTIVNQISVVPEPPR